MTKPVVIIPVHNRREITLRCLRNLAATGVLDWVDTVVIDDGSTDGTSDAIRASFPATTILPGDGNLWWGGAIRLGMDFAIKSGAEFAIWLNDDCLPAPGTLRLLVDHAERTGGIAAGWAETPSGGRYGGTRKTWQGLRMVPVPAPGGIVACDAAAGNCVVFPRSIITAIGPPDADRLPHSLLDADYTLTATECGFRLDLLGAAICHNDDNLSPTSHSWLLSEESPLLQWQLFRRLQSTHNYGASFRLHWRHWGPWGLWLFARSYLRLAFICVLRAVVPLRWLRAVFAARSPAFRRQQFYHQQSAQEAAIPLEPKTEHACERQPP